MTSASVRECHPRLTPRLDDRGQHTLKGVAAEWQLYEVTTPTEPNF